jgi:hypothetical protein
MIITGNRKKDKIGYHYKKDCRGSFCPIHNPSDHKMRDWPMNLRMDGWAFPLIERICPHGVGHPDPDSAAYLDKTNNLKPEYGYFVHGCDGCCRNDG